MQAVKQVTGIAYESTEKNIPGICRLRKGLFLLLSYSS